MPFCGKNRRFRAVNWKRIPTNESHGVACATRWWRYEQFSSETVSEWRGLLNTVLSKKTVESRTAYTIAPPPKKKRRYSLTNVSWLVDRHEERCCEKKHPHKISCFCKGLSNAMTSGRQGSPYFRRHGRELVSKPAISVKKSWVGYRRTTRRPFFCAWCSRRVPYCTFVGQGIFHPVRAVLLFSLMDRSVFWDMSWALKARSSIN